MMKGADAAEPQTLVECLRAFNPKERYWLLRNALGDPASELPLSGVFRSRLGKTLNIEIPPDAWWAMDFHIDWLFAALVQDSVGTANGRLLENPVAPGGLGDGAKRLIRGMQEDFDLVVAFERTIILIEAKGVTSWGNNQLASKCQRLQEWAELAPRFEQDVATPNPLDVYLVLASPRRPQKLRLLPWPSFVRLEKGLPFFLPLDLSAAPENFLVPERCDDHRRPAASGDRWRIRSAARPELDEN